MTSNNSDNALVPDLVNVSKTVRKRRAPRHDFKDGKGKVFAHRHDNGGGWVANTATVAETVKVTRNAQVFDFARVYDTCRIEGTSRVFGHATLHNNVRVCGNAMVGNWAVIRNNVQLGHKVVVNGCAAVSGNSSISGNVHISDQTRVHNTTIQGPLRDHVHTYISGQASINYSSLCGYCRVAGPVLIDHASLLHVFVFDSARISSSTVHTTIGGDFNRWLADGQPAPSFAPPPEDVVSWIEGTVFNSSYSGPRLEMTRETLLVALQMYVFHTSRWEAETASPIFRLENREMLICAQNIQSIDAARRHVHDGNRPLPISAPNIPQQPAHGAPVIPARGAAPDPGVSRHRRLIRLGE
jgi:hypothetical protein